MSLRTRPINVTSFSRLHRRRSSPRNPLLTLGNVVIASVAFLVVFRFADYPAVFNPDRGNYEVNFEEIKLSYEIGFEALQWICRDVLSLNFVQFWSVLIALQIFLVLIAIYQVHPLGVLAAVPSLIYVSQSIIGTQVRYGLALSLLVTGLVAWRSMKAKRAAILAGLACLVHNSAVVLMAAIIVVIASQKFLSTREQRWSWRKKWIVKSAMVLFLCAGLAVIAQFVETIAVNTKYNTYVNSEYFDPKSVTSIAYAITILCAIACASACKSDRDRVLLQVHMVLLLSVLVMYRYAILGGRVLIFSMYLEAITCVVLWSSGVLRNRLLGLSIWGASIVKLSAFTRFQ